MTERTVKIIAAAGAAAAVLWALAHYLTARKGELQDRPPGSPSIGPETTLTWPSGLGTPRANVRQAADLMKRLQSLNTQGSVP